MQTDTDSAERQRVGRVVFRVMLSGIFLVAGSNHLFRTAAIVGRLEQAPFGELATAVAPPEVLVLGVGVALLSGGLSLLVGFATRWTALGLILVVIPITVTVQLEGMATLGPLFKNIGLMGGLVYFATHGAESWSLDDFLRAGGPDDRARTAG